MFETNIQALGEGRVYQYSISSKGSLVTYSQVLHFWSSSAEFRKYFRDLLSDSPFAGYRWETRALSETSLDEPFEFVLVDSPGFTRRETDSRTYQEYFTTEDTQEGVVTFSNLRGDSTLIVPSPRTDVDAYGHLAAFIRLAPASQVDALWVVVAESVRQRLGKNPLWLSTAGGGVAWLHIRLDSRPKYYCYSPYKES